MAEKSCTDHKQSQQEYFEKCYWSSEPACEHVSSRETYSKNNPGRNESHKFAPGHHSHSRRLQESESRSGPTALHYDRLSRSAGLLDVRAFVIFRQAVVDAMGAAAVSADIWNEFLCSAYCTAFQDCLVLRGLAHLKSCLQFSLKWLRALGNPGNARLTMIIPIVNNSRVASPGREHCHSPVKGCWLARSHRHSRYSSHELSGTYRARTIFFSDLQRMNSQD